MSVMGENNTPIASSDEVISQNKQNSGPVASIPSSGVISQKKQKTGPKSGLVGHHGPSAVWNHFAKQLSEGTNKYSGTGMCNYCHKPVTAPSSHGTNKLWNHLKKCREFPGYEGDKTQTTLTFKQGQPSNWRFDQEKCRKALAVMVIVDELPFSFVENEGFRLFCEEAQPKFHVVGRTAITKDCLKLFYEEGIKLKECMKLVPSRVCITTDLWTSIQNLGYMVLTAHFIDKEWKLHKRIINFRVLPHPHTGEAIAKAIDGCLLEWGIKNLMTITLDNAKNNDSCVEDLKRRLNRRNGLLFGGEFFHVRCFAHVINLVVGDGIAEVQDTIIRLRRSVKYVRSSPSRLQVFKQCCVEEMVASKKSLCLDVKTRWNSTYLMINAAMDFEKVFDKYDECDPNYRFDCNVNKQGVMGDIDWMKLKALHAFLEEFYDLTKRISGSKYITSNTYFDELTQVKDLIMDHLASDDVFFCDMARKMNLKFDKYCKFETLNQILIVAIVLDPRYKMQYVEFWYDTYLVRIGHDDDDARKKLVETFRDELKALMTRLYNHYKLEYVSNEEIESSSILNDEGSNLIGKVNKRLLSKDVFKGNLKKKDANIGLNDLDKFLDDSVVEGDENVFNVLAWWKEMVPTYHTLAMLARDILTIPITSVASECAFSTAGRILDPFRSSLTPKVVESLVCAQDWLRTSLSSIEVEENLAALEQIEEVVLHELGSLSIGSTT